VTPGLCTSRAPSYATRGALRSRRAERNGPWATRDISLSRVATCSCLYERRCRRPVACIDDIGVDEVVDAVRQRLSVHV
jgi:hypothetical protein